MFTLARYFSFEENNSTTVNIITLSELGWKDDCQCPDSSSLQEVSAVISSTSFKSVPLCWLSQSKVPQRRHMSKHKKRCVQATVTAYKWNKIQVGCQTMWRCQTWGGNGGDSCVRRSCSIAHSKAESWEWEEGHRQTGVGILKKQTSVLQRLFVKPWPCPSSQGERRTETQQRWRGSQKGIFSATHQEFGMKLALSFHRGKFGNHSVAGAFSA